MKETVSFIKSLNINPDEYIIIACSGGPDSMCLLDILYKQNLHIVVAHINHNIRPESTSEYEFLKNYCKEKNIPFEGLELPHYENKNESFYRKVRLRFYKKIAQKYNSTIIMTAHHGDDLIETILMRITRGSHLKGYIGFKKDYTESNLRYLKPLVYMTKKDVLIYNKENDIPFVTDKTNEEEVYTRNRYRHNILPFLKSEQPNVHLKYLSFSEELEDAFDFIERITKRAVKENYVNKKLNIDKFTQLDEFIKIKELEYILKDTYGDDIDQIKRYHIELILKEINKEKNFKIDLPLDYKAIREYNILEIKKDIHYTSYEYILESKVDTPLGQITKVTSSQKKSNYIIRLNSEDLSLPLRVRTRKPQDKIYVKNMKGSKTIKSIMINEKISPSIRDTYPLLVDSSDNVLWIPGVKKSKFDNEINEKYDIILKYTRRKEKIDEKEQTE